jgi:hypothetical protein
MGKWGRIIASGVAFTAGMLAAELYWDWRVREQLGDVVDRLDQVESDHAVADAAGPA